MQSLLQVSSRQPTRLGSLLHALAAPLLSCTLQDARLDAALASEQHPLSAPPRFLEDVQGAQRWELYLHLWRALMAAPETLGGDARKQLEREYGREAVRRLRLGVYDTLMSYGLDAVRHLDLRYTLPTHAQEQQVTGEGGGGGGEESDAAATTAAEDAEELYGGLLAYDVRDMMSYFHLADFLGTLLPECGPALVARWAQRTAWRRSDR